jgi:hypothetical protein
LHKDELPAARVLTYLVVETSCILHKKAISGFYLAFKEWIPAHFYEKGRLALWIRLELYDMTPPMAAPKAAVGDLCQESEQFGNAPRPLESSLLNIYRFLLYNCMEKMTLGLAA